MKAEKTRITELAKTVLGMDEAEINTYIEYPPQAEMGDLALPCFRFAKALRKAPQAIAAEIAEVLQASGDFVEVTVAGAYVNVKVNRTQVADALVPVAVSSPVDLFTQQRHRGQTAAVDYSSPNIAKPFGVGHLRSTMIGQAIIRMLIADGFRVEGINHLGDWGTQFGKNIVAYRRWGDEDKVRANPVRELFHLYVRFHEEANEHPELEEEAREWFKRLEDGDAEATRLWKWFISESLAAFKQTYDLLGVQFDHLLGESFYNDKMQAVVDELQSKQLLTESEGAQVVDLSAYDMPPCLIRKSDGATIYATRDLASALYRHDVLGADHLIYVVGGEQKLHFAQVFKVLELMGRAWAKDARHVAFGMMKINGERMSTRRGKIVYLEDVLDLAISEAQRIIEEKNPALEDKGRIAQMVGVGAVIFNDLKNDRVHDVDFRMEDVVNFDGETGPYVQYTHTRASSVLRKADEQGLTIPTTMVGAIGDVEWDVIRLLGQANEVFDRALDDMDPSAIARFVLDLCHTFNRFYHEAPILIAEGVQRADRLALTAASKSVIAYALYLLGLEAPERM